ncbi:MAG: oligosaccharide flippase family protein [Candidatus Eremiobacteraeota bacterium]|nr:oligosaccharide flippase family protein [Candidatus Eremiobacteraeota bacterium]
MNAQGRLDASAGPPLSMFERIKASAAARQAALVFSSSMFLNVAGFVFHAIASRKLGVDAYGQLYALISACTVVALPVGLASPVIARFAAEFAALHDDSHMRAMTADVARWFGGIGAAGLVASLLLAVPVASFLHVPAFSVPIVAAIAAIVVLNASFRAIAQGTQSFAAFAASVCAEGAGKVVAVGALLALGFGLAGGVVGFLAGAVSGCAVIAIALVRRYRSVPAHSIHYDWKRIAISGLGAAAITITMTLVGNVDVVLVKHFFDASQAGLYSAASLGGKIMLYFVGFIPTILLPRVTDRHVRGEHTRQALFTALVLLLVISLCGIAAVKLFGLVLLHALVGSAFDAAHGLLVGYTIAMALLALILLLASYGIATHRLAFAAPLVAGTLATLSAMLFFHATLAQVVEVLVAGMAVTAAVVTLAIGWQGWRSTQCASP